MTDPLLQVALDLCAHLAATDRYRRLTKAARRLIPCDAIALLRLEGEHLIPVVVDGLRDEVTDDPQDPATQGAQISNPGYPRLDSGGQVFSGGATLEVGL